MIINDYKQMLFSEIDYLNPSLFTKLSQLFTNCISIQDPEHLKDTKITKMIKSFKSDNSFIQLIPKIVFEGLFRLKNLIVQLAEGRLELNGFQTKKIVKKACLDQIFSKMTSEYYQYILVVSRLF